MKGRPTMFAHQPELAYTVRVDTPDPIFARKLQQAIGGVEGEIRVMMQYLFQAWGARGPRRYRNMLLSTGTEEIGHVEMLATAVALNLEGAPVGMQDEAAKDPLIAAKLGGMDARQFLSGGLAAMPADANGVPFDCSHVYASGNLVADMYSNVAAEATGRLLATRLYESTDDPGMKDMLSYLIARDSMHQQQWLAVIEEIGTPAPVPADFPQEQEKEEFSHVFLTHSTAPIPEDARWTHGPTYDGRGEFTVRTPPALGEEPRLAPPVREAHSRLPAEDGVPAR
jgi:Mn-containing catalase